MGAEVALNIPPAETADGAVVATDDKPPVGTADGTDAAPNVKLFIFSAASTP